MVDLESPSALGQGSADRHIPHELARERGASRVDPDALVAEAGEAPRVRPGMRDAADTVAALTLACAENARAEAPGGVAVRPVDAGNERVAVLVGATADAEAGSAVGSGDAAAGRVVGDSLDPVRRALALDARPGAGNALYAGHATPAVGAAA